MVNGDYGVILAGVQFHVVEEQNQALDNVIILHRKMVGSFAQEKTQNKTKNATLENVLVNSFSSISLSMLLLIFTKI